MVLEKILLGITLSAPIGPVSLEMIKRGLDKGFLGAFVVRLGGAVGNTLCLIAAYFGLGLLLKSNTSMAICSLCGSIVLLYLGLKSLLDNRKHTLSNLEPESSKGVINGLLTGFVLSITSPIGIIFWLSIFAATLDHTEGSKTVAGLMQNFAIIGGVLIWGFCLSSILEIGKRYFNQTMIKLITTLAGVMLIYFGLKYGYKAFCLFTQSPAL